jgi:hypothetical protein
MGERLAGAFLMFCAFTVLMVSLVFLAAIPVMLGWNLAMPALFGLPRATYGNAVGLTVLIISLRAPTPSGEKLWTR